MSSSIGPLVHADEYFNHQIVETHASVQQSDYNWAEKVCGMVGRRDGRIADEGGCPSMGVTPICAERPGRLDHAEP